MPQLGVITGSGFYTIPGLTVKDSVSLHTPYGDPSDTYTIGTISDKEIAFLPRHGSSHHIQPHKINYRANLWGFQVLGVKRILSLGASGGISDTIRPGVIAVPDQIIDRTSGRHSTFYDEDEVVHIDFSEPFCTEMRSHFIKAAEAVGIPVMTEGTYACTNGPRLETAAEIKALSVLGADLVGMTAMPEASLARELQMCFAGISVVTNVAAGIAKGKLTTKEVIDTMQKSTEMINSILVAFFESDVTIIGCSCGESLKDAKI